MASNRKDLKSYVRYDGSGRIIPGSNILQRKKPKVGNWKETQAYECCDPFLTTTSTTTEAPLQALRLTFDSIESADLLVGDSLNVADWNTFFDLPTLGTQFSFVEVAGNEVFLYGGANIKVKPGLMFTGTYTTSLIEIIDEANCITSVGGDAFSLCSALTTVDLPACTELFGYEDSPFSYYGSFGECINLVNVSLPQLITTGSYSLAYCSSLVEISFPNLITSGESLCYSCSSLTLVNLPNLTTADGFCFDNCTSLITINLPSLVSGGASFFKSCTNLTDVNLPVIETIGNSFFYGCSSIETITLSNITNIPAFTFFNCVSLTTINIPQVTTLSEACFSGCTLLPSINLPAVTDVGQAVFSNCSALTSVSLINAETFGNNSFKNCLSLPSISLPSATSIDAYSFFNCDSLTSINLPACTNLGGTTGDDNVFTLISGNTITATFNVAVSINNSGNPDGDIQYLQSFNTTSITYI